MSSLCPVSSEEERGLRLIKLLDEATNVLRSYLLEDYVHASLTFEDALKKCKKSLTEILYKSQIHIVFPKGRPTNPEEYDISVLQVLLRVVKKISSPKGGWNNKPLAIDGSKSAHIVRICVSRNHIIHSRLRTSELEYRSYIQDLSTGIIGLGGDNSAINRILKQPIDGNTYSRLQSQQKDLLASEQKITELEEKLAALESTPKRNIRHGLMPLIHSFTGRENDVIEMHSYLDSSDKNGTVLVGLPGTGKTSLALYYCHEYGTQYDNIIWFNAYGPETLKDSFAVFATTVNVVKGIEAAALSLKEVANKIYKHFEEYKTLYIFDNTDDPAVLLDVLPASYDKAATLITSRSSRWGERFNEKAIDTLSEADTIKLINKSLPKELIIEETSPKLLHGLLQGYPLALQQSIAYMKYNVVSIEDYLEIFRNAGENRLLKFPADDIMYKNNLHGAVTLVLTSLQKDEDNDKVFELLNLLCFMDGLSINKTLLEKLNYEKYELDSALMKLEFLSLIQTQRNYQKRKFIINIHSLVQLVIRRELSPDDHERYLTWLLTVIEQTIADKQNHNHVDFGKPWLSHVLHLHEILSDDVILQRHLAKNKDALSKALKTTGHDKTTLAVLVTVEQYYIAMCGNISQDLFDTYLLFTLTWIGLRDWKNALSYCKKMDVLAESLKEWKVKNQINVKHHIAFCLSRLGKNTEACTIYTDLHEIEAKELGLFHRTTLVTEINIAMELAYTGRNEEAAKITGKTVEKFKNLPSYQIDETYYLANRNLADFLKNLGRFNEALSLIDTLYEESKTALGEKHLETLNLRSAYASLLTFCGKHEEALKMFLEITDQLRESYHSDHHRFIQTESKIGNTLMKLGRFSEALAISEKLHKTRTMLFDEKHEDVCQSKLGVADCLYSIGEYKRALEVTQELQMLEKKSCESNSCRVLIVANRIGNCLLQLGRYEEALETYNLLKDTRETNIDKVNHASCLHGMGKLRESLEIMIALCEDYLKTHGRENPETLVARYRLAVCLIDLGRYAEGIAILDEMKESKSIGPNSTYKLRVYSQLAKVFQIVGKTSDSEKCAKYVYDHGLELRDCHLTKLTSKLSQAKCNIYEGSIDKALDILQSILPKVREQLETSHPICLLFETTIAEGMMHKGENTEAAKILSRICDLQTKTLGTLHPDTLKTRYLFVKTLTKSEIVKDRLTLLKEIHKQQIQVIGEFHLDTLKTYREIALQLYNNKKHKQSKDMLDLVMAKLIELLGHEHEEVSVTKKCLEDCSEQSTDKCVVA